MKRIVVMLTLSLVLLGSSFLGRAAPPPSAPFTPATSAREASIVNEYRDLEPVVDFIGEENLSVLNLAGFRAANKDA